MKKKNTPYRLPNHSWLPGDWCPPGSEFDKPEIVVRRHDTSVLIRDKTWAQAKNPRYIFSKDRLGENHPNDSWKSFDLWMCSEDSLLILAQRAKDGSVTAAEKLSLLAGRATGLLAQVCETKPELIRPIARKNRQWPVFKRKDAKLTSGEKKLFDSIQLGHDDFIQTETGKAKWTFDDAGRIAYSLLSYIRAARADVDGLEYGKIGEAIRNELSYEFDDEGIEEWWKVAKEILLWIYPKPHAVDELKRLTPAMEAGRKKSPGIIDQDIFRILKNRFKAFAP